MQPVAAAGFAKHRAWEADFTTSRSHITKTTFPLRKAKSKPVCSWMPLLGVGSRVRTVVITTELAQEGPVGPFPIHLHGAKRVQRCSWDRRCWWPPQGTRSLQRSCFTRAKPRARGGKLFSKSWTNVTSHGLVNFFYLTSESKWMFIAHSLTG